MNFFPSLVAAVPPPSQSFLPAHFVPNLIAAVTFGVLGLFLILIGYKLFDWITPGIRVEQELAEKQNIAVAIVVGAVIVGVGIVVSRTVGN
jgi:putative membrane protein